MASGVDIIARGLGAKGLQEANIANARLDALPKGIVYRGAVDYQSDLPENPEIGDAYTVKYRGESGTDPDGGEYVWGAYDGSYSWIPIGPDGVMTIGVDTGLNLSGTAQDPVIGIANGYILPTEQQWASKQDLLVNQENIKSVNGESILGAGDIEIPTYSPFKTTWRNDTVAHLLEDIDNDVTATEGKSYLGEVLHVTASEGLFDGNAEIVVNIMRQISTTNKIIWCIVSSNNVDPYHWEATFSNGSISAKGWTPFVPGTRTIAGIDLKDNITVAELQTALSDSDHRFVTDTEKTEWSGKQDALVSGTNIKTINSTSLLGNGNIDTKELFYCSYGTTTYVEITQALSNGKLPLCFYNNNEYVYVGLSNTNRHTFASQLYDTNRYVSVNDADSWGVAAYNFEITNNKVTSLSGSSTDIQYPSAKCVYDELQLKQDTLVSGTNIKTINGNSLLGNGDIDTNSNLADYYSDTATYNQGDYCIYDHILYKCLATISTAEAWTPAHWTNVMITNELRTMNNLAYREV